MGPRIVVIGNTYAQNKEALSADTITPGHLIILNTSGAAIKHNVAGAVAAAGVQFTGPVMVAVERDYFSSGIDTAYVAGDQVVYAELKSGAEWESLVAAGAAAIAYGDFVESAGDGTVRKSTVQANAIGRAREALDNSLGASAARLRVEVL